MRHCTTSINVLSHGACNVFAYFGLSDLSAMWKRAIHLILPTNMAKHFTIVEEAKQLKRDLRSLNKQDTR
jgi:hypothetical protein